MEKHIVLSSLVLFSPIRYLLERTAHMGSVGPCFCNSPFLSQYLPTGKNHRTNKPHKISCSLGCLVWDISVLAGFQKVNAFCLLKNWFPNAGQQRPDRTGFPSVFRWDPPAAPQSFAHLVAKHICGHTQFSKERPLNKLARSEKEEIIAISWVSSTNSCCRDAHGTAAVFVCMWDELIVW